MEKIVGREKEMGKLSDYIESGRSEFVELNKELEPNETKITL